MEATFIIFGTASGDFSTPTDPSNLEEEYETIRHQGWGQMKFYIADDGCLAALLVLFNLMQRLLLEFLFLTHLIVLLSHGHSRGWDYTHISGDYSVVVLKLWGGPHWYGMDNHVTHMKLYDVNMIFIIILGKKL